MTGPEPHLRHVYDERVWASVYARNEYHLPDDMAGWSVLDIGGHIAAFSRLAAERGARVLAFEPDPHNRRLFHENVAHLACKDRIRLVGEAVAAKTGTGNLTRRDDPAGYTLCGGHDPHALPVTVRAFAEAVQWAGGQVDLCKIDAEGAEYDILEDPGIGAALAGVRRLAVEFHGGYVGSPEERAQAARLRLLSLGFREVAWEATHADLGWYRLYRGERE